MTRLVLVLGDQLTQDMAALSAADPRHDVVVMAEVADEATYVLHHPKKIAFLFAAMRKFASHLRALGWVVAYSEIDDTNNSQSICGELLRRAREHGTTDVLATEPGEWRLIHALQACPLQIEIFPDHRFLCSHGEFEAWARDRKSLRMEYFYRQMRRKTGILMNGDKPVGGRWNFDQDNRKPPRGVRPKVAPLRFAPDDTTQDVLALVERRFSGHFGVLRPFWFATDRAGALAALDDFIAQALPQFGDFQDAMLSDHRFLFHSVLSMYLNAGLLGWREVCTRAERAWHSGHAPLNAVEGFIRQIIGWREFVRGIYFREGPQYTAQNALDHTHPLPAFYWGAATKMRCVAKTVEQTAEDAYAHHIQRLMVTGNFATLAGLDPKAVSEWYLAVYADAYEWVEAPNVLGMALFADGGLVGSKPYVASGNYIAKMSDYCGDCAYSVKTKVGEGACPFNLLYWHFLHRHRTRFAGNPRMAQMYRTWDRMTEEKRDQILSEAATWLSCMAAGDLV